ncbi:MAG: dehydrogenase [Planctomycetes bacterium]|nr:dehydrogenase [Planctomycetota bacterium]
MKARREAIAAAAKGALYYERKGPIPVGADGKSLNLGFESGDLTDWTATGTAFARMPVKGDTVSTRRKDSSSEHAGGYWVGTYERDKSDKATGTLTSVPFVATHPYASFLVGGGRLKSLRAEIVLADTEKVVFSVSGRNRENMWPRFVDLTKHRDKKIYIRLVDNSKAAWGHINFDDFRFHDEKPAVKKRAEAESSSGKEPGEAAKAMSVPGGFRVDLIASEPELHQPIALTIDERGRLWVAEAHTYPKRQPDGKGRDKILVFEDADADGSFEKRTVFAEQLNLVSGLEVGFGGVWVGAAPYLLFIPDKDGDLVPDAAPVKLLDGFGYEDTHETLNAFIWGPDGWLYGCHGIFTHSKVGKPGTTEESRVPLNAGVWRYHPTRHDFEVFAWGSSNPWGVDFDDNGQAFITACVIPHLYHVIQGARYHRQSNKHFNRYVFADIKTIADHLHYLGSRGDAGNGVSDSVGGGHAHCGAMIYAGDSFPDAYRGRIFFSNIHGNRINTDHLLPSGSGFIGSHGADFLVANDRWFRGVNLKYGPSGNVYLIDWYDQRACHSKVPKLWDRSNGRLYRVSYGEPGVVRVDLAEKSSAELVALHLHKNKWYVRMARRLLQERGPDPKVHLALEAMLTSNPDPATKLSALWTLHATGGLRHEMAMEHLDSPLPYLRGWAVQLLLEDRQAGPDLVAKLARMAKDDDSPVARLYLASALQRLPLADRWAIAEELVARAGDRTDHNLPLMYWYGIEPLVMTDPARALRLAQATPIPLISRFIVRRMATDQKPHLAPLVAALTKSDEAQQEMILGEMLTALEKHGPIKRPPGWDEVAKALARSDKELIRDRALNLAAVFGVTAALRPLRECLTDRKLEKRRRAQALKSLLLVKDGGTLPLLRGLLDDLQMAGPAIRGLAKFDDPKTAALLIDRYLQMRHSDQKDTVSTLTARASWAKAMLASIAAKKIPATVLDSATTRRQIAGLKDEGLDKLMQVAWGHSSTRSEDKQKLIKAWQKKLPGELIDSADLSNGRAVFARTCMKCHKLFGLGREVGPDLTGSNRGNLNYILSNILDPSGEVAKDYLSTVLSTKDGRMITGLLVDDNDRSVTLKTENEEVVVARADINIDEDGKPELWTSTTSMMPEGQLDGMKFDDVRDMIAYLASDEQVPMTATAENLATFFTGEDLTGWTADPSVWRVENGEIVGRAEKGLKKNNFASSHLLLGDFRLTLEVKLVEDRGNSGIQFRSETLVNGAMKGYQADIGVGWWGKLYEEHGRGLIWKKPGDALVKKGEWNTYEILAVGGRVQTAINGALCVDLVDKSGAHRGVIGLQLHSGGPTEVRFRNLKLELAPTFVLKTVE